MAGERTEKATPKKRDEARKKGKVARSIELNGAVVLLAALLALSAFGPAMVHRLAEATISILQLAASPQVVSRAGIGAVIGGVAQHIAFALAPVLATCTVTGVAINLLQTGGKPSLHGLKPDPTRINPLSGFKQMFGPNAIVEAGKGLLKVVVIGGVAALDVFPRLQDLAAMVGMPASELLPTAAADVLHVAQRAAIAYLVIAFADLAWQRHRFEKSLRMDKQEVKDENKQNDLPPEVRSALRRKAMEAARRRMMDAVPTADVIVTNPTHYSVALRYDRDHAAPVVVAKGKDHVAFRIREIAREAGVAVVPDPPLARTLHASVEIGHMIPEELYQAVAQLLAYVYRVAGRRAASSTAGVAA
jgi:flagellar biosynthetic protein FlhB